MEGSQWTWPDLAWSLLRHYINLATFSKSRLLNIKILDLKFENNTGRTVEVNLVKVT
jgi:hypothetical protein